MAPRFLLYLVAYRGADEHQKLRPTRIRDFIMALVHCRECGEMISEFAPTCPKCGASQNTKGPQSSAVDQDPSVGLNIVSLVWPFIGLILYLVYNDKSPRRAKECGKWALWGVLAAVVLGVIFTLIIGAATASAVSSFAY